MCFKRKRKKDKKIVVCNHYYELIDSKQIINQYDPEVIEFDTCSRKTEEEYTYLVKALQSEFEEYKLKNGNIEKSNLMRIYMSDPVRVRLLADGRYRITVGGRHRAYVAMKNKLKLLVLVMDKEEYV